MSLRNLATTRLRRCQISQQHTRIDKVHTWDIIAMFVDSHHCEIRQTGILCVCEILQTHSMCVCEISQRHALCFCEIPQRHEACLCEIPQTQYTLHIACLRDLAKARFVSLRDLAKVALLCFRNLALAGHLPLQIHNGIKSGTLNMLPSCVHTHQVACIAFPQVCNM